MLHTVHWPSNITYRELILIHSRSVRNMFGQCEVVFDGYTTNSVKDHEHLRRSSKVKCKEVQFLDEMKVIHKCEDFLSNPKQNSADIKAGSTVNRRRARSYTGTI